jgi:CBS domain containing-hemolysin-like protein
MSGGPIAIIIVFIVIGGITASVVAYFSLQRHRADAVAMASYRKLAEQAVANQEQLRDELATLTARLAAVEQLLKDVG